MANKASQPVDQQQAPVAQDENGQSFDWEALLAGLDGGNSVLEYGASRHIFTQGDPADTVFYLREGKGKLAVTSSQGREAIVAFLEAGDFFGEGCLAGQPLRIATAIAVTDCTLIRIEKQTMTSMLHENHGISELLAQYLIARNIRFEEDLLDHLFNSSEKRLARNLLLLSHFGGESRTATVPRINQETLAQMVGTTRSRVSHFMNEFRERGFINYESNGELTVHSSLLNVVQPTRTGLENALELRGIPGSGGGKGATSGSQQESAAVDDAKRKYAGNEDHEFNPPQGGTP